MADRHIPGAEIRRVWLDPRLTSAEAASAVGLSRSNLWHRAKTLGLPPRKLGRRFALVDEALFRRMWTAGVAAGEIARHFGMHPLTVRSLRARYKLQPRASGGFKRPLTLAQFAEMTLSQSMAEQARRETAALKERGMVDVILGKAK